jgi:putative ABC transport system permease protein
MVLLRHALRLVVREPQRSAATALGVAIAAALVVSVLLFGSASGATVTSRALAGLPIDAQVVLAPGADAATVERTIGADAAVGSVLPFTLVHFDTAAAEMNGTATQTSAGVILGLDPGYPNATGLFALSSGAAVPGQTVISRDLASNLGVVPGDTIRLSLPGGAAVSITVSGIVDITGADLILGPLDAAHRAAGANPPTNVAVVDRATLDTKIASQVPGGATAGEPSAGGATPSGGPSPVFVPEPAVRRELHVRFDHAQLPGDPASAQGWLDGIRRRLERQGAGTFTVVDDASATLEPIAGDLAWGQILFIFLALPGIALALALSRLSAEASADATRRHAALLRARGATSGQLHRLFLATTLLSSLVGALVGAVGGIALSVALFGPEMASVDLVGTVVRVGLAGIVAVTALAVLAAALPLRAQLREEVATGRQELQRLRPPIWQRLDLDIVALIAGAVVYVVVGGTGVHPVLNAEGNPTVTLALTSFVAPFLFWTGGTLLLLRLAEAVMRRSAPIARLLRRPLGPGGELAGQTLASRATAASRAIALLALAVSFATSVLIFDATYRQQQRVDAELTLGADLKATSSDPVGVAAAGALRGPGVASTTPFIDRVVYVGAEAQDLLAVDPTTLSVTAPLADTFFERITAPEAIAALRTQPDAILVSSETAKDYSLVLGDRVRIRIPDASGNLRTVDFRMAGVALEFPTAPKDAFLVANLSYVAAQTANDRISYVLARADGDVASASEALARRLGSGWQVTDLGQANARLANSITSVDLADLVLIDLVFAVLTASVGVGLFLLAGIVERRREIATLEAVGAEPAQIRAALVGETLVVGVAGTVVGLVTGILVGFVLLQILSGVFDPPADVPVVPIAALAAAVAMVALGLAVATAVADRGASRLRILSALRER